MDALRNFIAISLIFVTGAVALGVYWEAETNSDEKKLQGWRTLLVALSLETFLTFMLYLVDSSISRIQQEKISLLEMEVQPRDLSDEQWKNLVTLFQRHKGQTIHVSSYNRDIDGFRLSRQIIEAARRAKNPVDDKTQHVETFGSFTTGVSITGDDQKFIEEVVAQMSTAGVGPVRKSPVEDNYMNVDEENAHFPLKIFIGLKPIFKNEPN